MAVDKKAHPFTRESFEELMRSRFFYTQSFEIYGGVAGFYDFGPPGSALQANILNVWRNHFIIEDEMLEIDSTIMTVADVLKTSGHVDKFTDWMVKDTKTGDIFRADHLVEAALEAKLKGDQQARGIEAQPVDAEKEAKSKKKKVKATAVAVRLDDSVIADIENVLAQMDNYDGPGLQGLIEKFQIKAPETGNDLTEPKEFNLMFDSNIGPTGQVKGYLRPETAQGHFINFNRLLEFNNGKVPFASAQIGKSFRNEISPRQGLLRVREFVMAEIEHYVDPAKKKHPKFAEVKDQKLALLPKETQSAGKTELLEITIGEAVEKGIVDNETLGYFMVRIYLFLIKIGIDPSRLRFRQHMGNEMAHYASDCWDAEIQNSYGWIECVGCADRSAYDLSVHSAKTGVKLVVREALEQPKIEERTIAILEKKVMGPKFKKAAKIVEDTIMALDQERLDCIGRELQQKGSSDVKAADGQTYELTPDIIKIERKVFKESRREFVPNVIEPSFGIGRILYSLLEHSYWSRPEDVERRVLSLPPSVAPIKCLIVPLSNNEAFKTMIREVSKKMRSAGISCRVDDSGASIGKRYARNDELGTPFGVTVDFASVKNDTITLRDRDTTGQLIGKTDEVISVVEQLCSFQIDWEQATKILKPYTGEQAI
ncbi:glycyl-tRNA synthetase [Cystobasidium minutum MCA 4210]|uniref:glycyl-tRNA synthetase n=1 Tax=Cystobasidium minutum MCA 4210 TaxID=1397322 RepID=UPI0034CFB3EE|eukprot:jgi/Rhomi1/139489/e_gw1.1.38.1